MNAPQSQSQGSRNGVALRLAGGATAIGLLGLALGSAAPTAQDENESRVDSARAIVEQYVQVRELISKEKREWTLDEEYLRSRIELLELEVASIRKDIQETKDTISETDTEREELSASLTALKDTQAGVAEVIADVEAGARSLIPRLPEPAADRVRLVSQQIPAAGEETELSLGIRSQNTIAMLDQLNKFDRTVHVGSGLVTASDGSQVNVSTIHVGLGRAYYASPETASKGPFAGAGPVAFGDDSEATWAWQPFDDAHQAVIDVIKVAGSELPPAFVQLPVLDPIKSVNR